VSQKSNFKDIPFGLQEGLAECKTISKDNLLIKEGDESNEMYVVKKGKFSIIKNIGGTETEIQTLGVYEIIGEMSFIDGSVRSATVKALEDGEVWVIARDKYDILFKSLPRWYVALFETIIRRLRDTSNKIKV
jgi:CRP/FNR family transcriptional regulator, cyclic AMP receptor protein